MTTINKSSGLNDNIFGSMAYGTKWDRVRRARALRAQSLTYREIGLIMGVTRQRVHQILRYIGKCADPPRTMPKRIRKCKKCGLGGLQSGRRYHEECRPRAQLEWLICNGCGGEFARDARYVRRNKKDPRYRGRNFCRKDCYLNTPTMKNLRYIKCCNDKCDERIEVTAMMRYAARNGQGYFFHNRGCVVRKGRTPVALQ